MTNKELIEILNTLPKEARVVTETARGLFSIDPPTLNTDEIIVIRSLRLLNTYPY